MNQKLRQDLEAIGKFENENELVIPTWCLGHLFCILEEYGEELKTSPIAEGEVMRIIL